MASRVEVELSQGLGWLGYIFVPNAVLDPVGNLIFPTTDFAPPASWSETSRALAQLPAWGELISLVGRFTVQEPANYWRCWRTALNFQRETGEVHLTLVRQTPIGADVSDTQLWCQRVHQDILVGRLQQFAGRRHKVPPGLLDFLGGTADAARTDVESHPGWNRERWPDLNPDDSEHAGPEEADRG
jgi:hypothetical protein